MAVLRLPATIPMGFVASAHRYHRPALSVRLSRPALAGSALAKPGVLGLSSDGSPLPDIVYDGTARASQVPGGSSPAFATLIRPRPRLPVSPISTLRCCPRQENHEGRSYIGYFEAVSRGFSTRCLRFQIRLSLLWQDSLPMGG